MMGGHKWHRQAVCGMWPIRERTGRRATDKNSRYGKGKGLRAACVPKGLAPDCMKTVGVSARWDPNQSSHLLPGDAKKDAAGVKAMTGEAGERGSSPAAASLEASGS